MAPFYVPFDSDSAFIGRDADLARLHSFMSGGAGSFRRAALVGMGGIGKTHIAVEYACRYQSAYPGGIYLLNAAMPLTTELAMLADRLGLWDEPASEAERHGCRLRAFERYLHERPNALVIIDNLADLLSLREPIAGTVLSNLPCHILATTRRREPASSFECLSVTGLPEKAALHLLLARTPWRTVLDGGPADELHAAEKICQELGYLPLAIVLAGAYLSKSSNRSLTLAAYHRRLRKEGRLATADAAKIAPAKLATQHVGLTATLRTHWDDLVNPDARHALQVAALLRNGAHISRAMLSRLTGLSNEASDGYYAPLDEALTELSDWSLIEELAESAIRLHPLVQEFAASKIEDRQALSGACAKRLREALGTMGLVEKEVRARGLDAVLADLRLGEELGEPEERDLFRKLLRPLDREAHSLRAWDATREPAFFLQQVRNVSFELRLKDVQEQAEAALRAQRLSYLRERERTSQESDALVRTLVGHTSYVWAVALTPDGRSALSASTDGAFKIWELGSGCELRALPGHMPLLNGAASAAAINGLAVTSNGHRAVSASDDCKLKVWDLESGREIRELCGHSGPVNAVAVTPDDRYAISASDDCTIKVWDIDSGRLIRTLEGHTQPVCSVIVTPDGRRLISTSEDCTLKVWEIDSGRVILTLTGHSESIWGVAVTPDGRFAVSASDDSTLKVWDLSTGRNVRTLRDHQYFVTGLAIFLGGARAISASSDGTLKVWNLVNGRLLCTLEGHSDAVKAVAVTQDGRFAVSASIDNTLKVWDLAACQEVRAHRERVNDVPRMAMTSDGRFGLSGSKNGMLRVLNLSQRKDIRSLPGRASPTTPFAVTQDERIAILTSEDGPPKAWDLKTGRELFELNGHTWGVTAVAMIPGGGRVVTASPDATIRIWDIERGVELFKLEGHQGAVNAIAVTLDGRSIISASEDMTLKVWDLESHCERLSLAGHTAGVTAVAVSPDGRFVLSGSRDNTIKIWDLATGQETNTLRGHAGTVNGVAMTPDCTTAISTSEDATLRVWQLGDGASVAKLEARAPFLNCAVIQQNGRNQFLAVDLAGSLHTLEWDGPFAKGHSARNADSVAPVGKSPAFGNALRDPLSDPMSPHELRSLIEKTLRSDSDIDAFCHDFFKKDVYDDFSDGMGRRRKITILLERVPNAEIVAALKRYRSSSKDS